MQKGSPAVNAAAGNYPSVTVDMDGQKRKLPFDVGADEVSNDKMIARILNSSDVGVTGK